MRLFIGLDLSKESKLALDDWRFNALPELCFTPRTTHGQAQPRAIPPKNFHITLCFLGQVEHSNLDELIERLDDIICEPITLQLDTTGYWQTPKIVFAAPTSPPDTIKALAKQTRKAARSANIEVENRPYRPHVTLVRKANSTLPPPLFTPDITCNFDKFHLFESVSTPSGVTYPIRHSWSLKPAMSLREQLKNGLIG